MNQLFLIGLPGAGKTTFLAALYHVVESGEVPTSLRLDRTHGDYSHLNSIRDLWADAKELERTKIPNEQSVSMILLDVKRGQIAETVLPDLSGESFELQWTDRQMTSQYADLIKKAVGGLILVHPASVGEETLIADVENIVKKVQAASAASSSAEVCGAPSDTTPQGEQKQVSATPKAPCVWQAKDAPTALKLVELLQFIARIGVKRPIRLAVVVSAWDRIKDDGSPSDWVAGRLPLVFQYLRANPETFTPRFFGVSAQGDELANARSLQAISRPTDRIRVVGQEVIETHDISVPVQWIAG